MLRLLKRDRLNRPTTYGSRFRSGSENKNVSCVKLSYAGELCLTRR